MLQTNDRVRNRNLIGQRTNESAECATGRKFVMKFPQHFAIGNGNLKWRGLNKTVYGEKEVVCIRRQSCQFKAAVIASDRRGRVRISPTNSHNIDASEC